jgi:hypothetical protein
MDLMPRQGASDQRLGVVPMAAALAAAAFLGGGLGLLFERSGTDGSAKSPAATEQAPD